MKKVLSKSEADMIEGRIHRMLNIRKVEMTPAVRQGLVNLALRRGTLGTKPDIMDVSPDYLVGEERILYARERHVPISTWLTPSSFYADVMAWWCRVRPVLVTAGLAGSLLWFLDGKSK